MTDAPEQLRAEISIPEPPVVPVGAKLAGYTTYDIDGRHSHFGDNEASRAFDKFLANSTDTTLVAHAVKGGVIRNDYYVCHYEWKRQAWGEWRRD